MAMKSSKPTTLSYREEGRGLATLKADANVLKGTKGFNEWERMTYSRLKPSFPTIADEFVKDPVV
jgi:hypothetical protein